MPRRKVAEAESNDTLAVDQRNKRPRRGSKQVAENPPAKTKSRTEATDQNPVQSNTSTEMTSTLRLKELHTTLVHAAESKPDDVASVRSQLTRLKIALSENGYLVPSLSTSAAAPNGSLDIDSLVIARDTLEIGAFFSIRVKDINSFDRYIDLLKVFYNDFRRVGHTRRISFVAYKTDRMNSI